MNWDAEIKASDRALVEGFFAQSKSFEEYAGRSVFTAIDHFDEHGDQGNFSGIASVGLAARLMVSKRDGAPAAAIDRERALGVDLARQHEQGPGRGICPRCPLPLGRASRRT